MKTDENASVAGAVYMSILLYMQERNHKNFKYYIYIYQKHLLKKKTYSQRRHNVSFF